MNANIPNSPHIMPCEAFEALLIDALDGTLNASEQSAFDRHATTCAPCSSMLAEAQRGAAWIEMLKSPRPEPSADLLQRILNQTSGSQMPMLVPAHPALSTSAQPTLPINVLSFRPRPIPTSIMRQSRLAMTAAMAFFSVALTMNLLGVRAGDVKLSALSPSNLRRNLFQVDARAAQFYDNLRVVNQFESQLQQLERSTTPDPNSGNQTTPGNTPQQPSKPAGSSSKDLPSGTTQLTQITPDRRTPRAGASS